MAKTLDELFQEVVNRSFDQLLNDAREAINKVMPYFNKVADDGDGAKFVVPVICTVMAADGKFTELEYKFIKTLIGSNLSYDQFKGIIQQYYSQDWMDTIDNLIDTCDKEIKAALLSLCLYFAAVDERISKEETAFLKKLIV